MSFGVYIKPANYSRTKEHNSVEVVKLTCKCCKNTLDIVSGIVQSSGTYDKKGG